MHAEQERARASYNYRKQKRLAVSDRHDRAATARRRWPSGPTEGTGPSFCLEDLWLGP